MSAATEQSEPRYLWAVPAAVTCGVMVAVQSRMNGQLAEHTGAFLAAWFSFGSGLLLLSLLWVLPRFRARVAQVPAALRDGRLRWWQVCGGVFGGLLVGVQAGVVSTIGVAAFLIAVIGGQTVSASVVDRLGIGPGGRRPITSGLLVAAALAVVGVAMVSGESDEANFALLPVALAFGVGMGVAVQQAWNATVTVTATRGATGTAWINFVMGSMTLLVIGAVPVIRAGFPSFEAVAQAPWWVWFGGICGVVFIALAAWGVAHLGVLVFGLVTVASQLVVGLVLDLANPHRSDPGLVLYLGLGLTLLAAGLAAVAAARARRRSTARG